MTPDRLAILHAKCFETPRPWGADEFEALLQTKGTFLESIMNNRAAPDPGGGVKRPPVGADRALPGPQVPQAGGCGTVWDKTRHTLGFIIGRVIIDEAELLTLAVDPAHQRQGHGQKLLAKFEAKAATRNAKTAFLEVAEDNTAARALYQSAGYSESGRRPAYYHPPQGAKIDAIILRKPLI